MSDTHRFPWKWYLKDLERTPKNGLKIFTCFSCGGGSSMGYKLAGYDVIGNVEIDPRVMRLYEKNNHPRYPFLMDVRDFLKLDNLPAELYDLDILDGSPPCSVFSTVGKREKGWNVEKVFREGQAKQKLDDLFIYFINISNKLKSKVVIAENVSGLIKGNAKGYVNEILARFDEAGYKTQLFLLNAAVMGVPQKRERCFFIAQRKDMNFPKLELKFDEKPILFGEIRSEHGVPVSDRVAELLKKRRPADICLADIAEREGGKRTGFSHMFDHDNAVCYTIASSGEHYRFFDGLGLSDEDIIAAQTFPQDYDFGDQQVQYICGMSVPPVMMAQIATQIYRQWFSKAGSEVDA